MLLIPFAKGFLTSASLIMAIGAQNAFVLKQGIMKSHVFIVALLCSLIDSILICIGIAGMGKFITSQPNLLEACRYGGGAFLFYYGAKSFFKAYKSTSAILLEAAPTQDSLKLIITTLLFVSFINPHTYLDTIILIGSIGAHFEGIDQVIFAFGASTASIIWFFSVSYGAGYLAPFFTTPSTWRILDIIIGIIMWSIAISLIWMT